MCFLNQGLLKPAAQRCWSEDRWDDDDDDEVAAGTTVTHRGARRPDADAEVGCVNAQHAGVSWRTLNLRPFLSLLFPVPPFKGGCL